MAVITTGKIVGFQEGIIDMTGPGADYTPFSKLHNVVVIAEPKSGVLQPDHEAAVRLIGFKAAAYLAETGREAKADEEKVYEHLPIYKSAEKFAHLPKVAYVYMLQTQGLLHDTYVYGVDAKRILPTLMSPTEMFDGAIVSGNCVSACDKNPTIVHCNSPVITDLLERHGVDFNFIGVVITNENVTLADKERSSNFTTKLVEMLGAEAVIISEEGFGNPDADLMMNCVKNEKKGVKTVLVTDEYAGRDGASQSLADANPLANACVTAGNANEVILLPPMAKVIGHPEVANVIAGGWTGSLRADGSIETEIQVITGATNELGYFTLTAKQI
jgi:glycine reductase